MTRLIRPTDTLVRVPFNGLTDFQPLALAPGLPMLDGKKLTYQILLGWFGDLLAEPELDDEGVVFRVQRNGKPQVIVERAPATREDLDGPLQPEFERLKKSLFDVRPVSPSERLIFNRLQPPIGNHEGFLYRVLTESGEEQLVWCWGFQRRTQYGEPRLCTNLDCSMLFLHDTLAEEICPHCHESFAVAVHQPGSGRSRVAIKVAAAAAVLAVVAGGSFWINSHVSELSAHTVSDVVAVEQPETEVENLANEIVDHATSGKTVVAESAAVNSASDEPEPGTETPYEQVQPANDPPDLFVALDNLPSIDLPNPELVLESKPLESTFPDVSLPPTVSLPDLPDVLEPPAVLTTPATTVAPIELPVVSSDIALPLFPDDKSALPEVAPEPLIAQAPAVKSKPDPFENDPGLLTDLFPLTDPVARPSVSGPTPLDPSESLTRDPQATSTTTTTGNPQVQTDDGKSDLSKPSSVDPLPGVDDQPAPENIATRLDWHEDYVAAFAEASQRKQYLLMLFRDKTETRPRQSSASSLFAPSLQPMLEQFIRVELPVNTAMPATFESTATADQNDLPQLLLNHRSFRHLGVQPGIVVVDLTDPESANYARVVSSIPLPGDGLLSTDELMLAFNLPKGTISQRTLLLAIRRNVPDSSLSMREFSATLVEQARRNSRMMAHSEQSVSFEQDLRREAVVREFGPRVELLELVFATENRTTVQDAALQAVNSWSASSDSFEVLTTPAKAMGMDMFQSPETGRWYVTCFVIR